MASSAAWSPTDRPDEGGGVPPADLYRVAVEEYRWQAQFNWSRTQYLLAFNAAILAAATALGSQHGKGAALVFVLGTVAASLSVFAVRAQHDYYRAARDRMRRIEVSLGVPADQRTDSTATLGGRSRLVSVNQIVYGLFVALGGADIIGCIVIILR